MEGKAMKTLTIGITTYDNEPFISNLIYEIENQVKLNKDILKEVNFVLYDDKSSKRNFLEYLPSYIDVKVAEENTKTPATGRNYIIDKSDTKYVVFFDGDDLIIRDIDGLIQELKTKSADVFFSEVVKIGADGQYLKSPFIYTDKLVSDKTPMHIKKKICSHQTGIWSIYNLEFLRKNSLKYETNMRYEDNYFLYNLLLKNPIINTIDKPYYGWRNNYTSFSYTADSLKHRVLLYKKTMTLLKDNLDNEFAPYILFSVWNQTYSNIIRNYPDLDFDEAKVFFNALKKVTNSYKKEINTLKLAVDKTYVDKYFKYSKYKIFSSFYVIYLLKTYKRMIYNKTAIKKGILKLFIFLPINKRKIFLMSQYGEYSSNPKYFYMKLKEQGSKKKICFFVKDKKNLINKDFKDYNNRLSFYYHFYTAKDIYFDTWLDPTLFKRTNQNWHQMWHGYPYKKIYTDIKIYKKVNNNNKRTKKEKNVLEWDDIGAVDKRNTKIFQKLFPSVNVITQQYSRIEWLIKNKDNEKLKEQLKQKYKLEKGKKYTLYAPTYRPYKVYLDINKVRKLKNKDNILLYHKHPLLKEVIDYDGIELKSVDIQEILLIIDELITDYSSIKYDFLQINTKEKIKMYEPDKALYKLIHGLY